MEAGFIHFRHIVLNISVFSLAHDVWRALGGVIGKGIIAKWFVHHCSKDSLTEVKLKRLVCDLDVLLIQTAQYPL